MNKVNVITFCDAKVIDGFHILGQKVKRGEKAGELI